jgi:hypothetical protein
VSRAAPVLVSDVKGCRVLPATLRPAVDATPLLPTAIAGSKEDPAGFHSPGVAGGTAVESTCEWYRPHGVCTVETWPPGGLTELLRGPPPGLCPLLVPGLTLRPGDTELDCCWAGLRW